MINTITKLAVVPTFLPNVLDTSFDHLKHKIKTRRLYLRPVSESDLFDYVELFSDAAVMRYVGIEAGCIPSFEEMNNIHQGAVQAWESRGYGRWSMFDAETNDFVGFCGFRVEQGVPELICMLHERYWGRGLAVEAAAACFDYGFESLGFTQVKAFTRPDHSRARQVLNKLGAEFVSYVDFHGVEGTAYIIKPNRFEF